MILIRFSVDNSQLGISTGQTVTASSFGIGYEPEKAKLTGTGYNNWCASTPISNAFLMLDIGRIVVITQIAVGGGLQNGDGRVTNYSLSHSNDKKIWEMYREDELYIKVRE
jgi:hypothetical protein